MERLFVNPRYAAVFAGRGWNSFSSVFLHFLPAYSRRGKMLVQRVTLPTPDGEIPAFFKLYHHARSGWSFWMRASKARREFENYATFERLGVPAAERIACGEERDWTGRLNRAFIITRALPASELDAFFRATPRSVHRRQILAELAGMVRRLHSAGFFHHDLVARNVLVSQETPEHEPRLFLIDCPRGGFASVGKERKRLRDLASLDKKGSQLCSRAERLRFLLRYLDKPCVDDEVRLLTRACFTFGRERWADD
jgi:tRNA A-37 threonylcarbamoyl transferase component Bud32